MKRFLCLLLLAFVSVESWAQMTWHNPMSCGYEVVQNQAFAGEIDVSRLDGKFLQGRRIDAGGDRIKKYLQLLFIQSRRRAAADINGCDLQSK